MRVMEAQLHRNLGVEKLNAFDQILEYWQTELREGELQKARDTRDRVKPISEHIRLLENLNEDQKKMKLQLMSKAQLIF